MSLSRTCFENMSIYAHIIDIFLFHVANIDTLFRKDLIEFRIQVKVLLAHLLYTENAYPL